MISPESLILDLVVQWEEAASSGQPKTVETVCSAHPELIAAVRERISALRSVSPFFLDGQAGETPLSDCGIGPTHGEIRFDGGKFFVRGGLGEVFLADDKALHRRVALK